MIISICKSREGIVQDTNAHIKMAIWKLNYILKIVIILCGYYAYIFSDTAVPEDILPHFSNEGIEA